MPHIQSHTPTHFNLHLLGTFRLDARGQEIRLPRRKVEALLAYLALFPDSAGHAREKLAALFWGDAPDEQARMSLRTSLAVIRKTLGEGALTTDRERAQINPDFPLNIDVREFLQARTASPEHAVELYRGDLLADFYDDWVLQEREHLRGRYIETLALLTQHLRSQSEYERAIEFARKILATDPAHETAHQHIMFCEMARSNRSAALDQYEACVRALRDELAVEPSPETQSLYHWIKQTPTLTLSDAARITNLPIPLTSFIGRKTELAQVKALIIGSRLLTLTGTGGTGKTRLSIQAAMDLMNTFRDGVWWIELASITNAALVPQAVAKAMGIGEKPKQTMTETLISALRSKNVLLILDNCEHLIVACAELAELLVRECANLKILATSREPLNIPGESVWHVPTLSVPAELPTREQLMLTYESVRLFVERARAVNPEFELTEDNVHAVTQICRRLDGIPLAIELAAARIAILSPQEITVRLDDRFNLLTHGSRTALPRQQTLRALVDWSYDLLAEEERTLLRRLAVFSGGRTLATIENVCAFGAIQKSQVLDLMTRLVAKSLIIPERSAHDGETRYGFLDTIKHYAREKLTQSGEEVETRQRHLDYFVTVTETIAPELGGARQTELVRQIEREHANLRVALRFALDHQQPENALRLCNALSEFWDVRGYLGEARESLRRALEAGQTNLANSPTREFHTCYAWAQVNAAQLATKQGDLDAALGFGNAGLATMRELQDQPGIVTALNILGIIARMQSDWTLARTQLETALQIARELHDRRRTAGLLRNLGIVFEFQGDYGEARRLYKESLQLSREQGDSRAIALTLSNLGNLAQQQGDYASARELYDQILTIHREMGARWSVAATLTNLGNLAHSQGDYAAARDFHEEGLRTMREIGDKRGIAILLNNLGNATLALGDFPAARKLHEESLRLRRELNDKRGIAIALGNLGDVASGMLEYAQAQKFYADSLLGLSELGDKLPIVNCLIGSAETAAGLEQYIRAAKLTGGIHALIPTMEGQIDTRESERFDRAMNLARTYLDAAAFDVAWNDGLKLTMAQTIELATGTGD
jgi:predicted ATPase/DNA-binding SARP family transcriptional activator/Tfp pilus assembly protein PilF